MQQPLISAQDKKDLDKFSKFLCVKTAQVIVQGRLGKSISSQCSPLPTGAEWFNLAIKDYPEIQKEAKFALIEGNPTFDSSFIIEISLRTSDSESLTLEVWSLSVKRKYEDVRIHHTVYNRMSLLLKSLMCVSRATPAYKLSQKQGSEYVICFRVYMGKVDISGLGEGFKTLRVGSIGTPTGTLMLSAVFRTAENLHVSTKKLHPGTGDLMKVSPDHFTSPKNATLSPARPCHTLQSRIMSSRDMDGESPTCHPIESPSYGVLPTSFSTSPGELGLGMSQHKFPGDMAGAIFSVGTPPTQNSTMKSKTTSSHSVDHRRHSDYLRDREGKQIHTSRIQQQTFIHSQSEKNFSDPIDDGTRTSQQQNVHHMQGSSNRRRTTSSSVPKDNTSSDILMDKRNVFKPITDESFNENSSRSSSNHRRSRKIITVKSGNRTANTDIVTALKSNSPSNARVGFPDNAETTTHLAHLPPSHHAASVVTEVSSTAPKQQQHQLHKPSTGAFVSNSKTAARAQDTLIGVSGGHKLPFEDLITEDNSRTSGRRTKRNNTTNETNSSSDTSPESGREDASTITRLSSQSSLSSHQSSESSPSKENILGLPSPADEFVMVDLNPAFGKNDSAGDLGTFYRECENAPDLVMFQDNNGQETQEALLDLTKQLEDYEKDAVDFDNFAEEIQALP
ncbi:uncharacterized protein LOC120343484 [Styela clava]